jgi:hypothetical protein
MPIRRPGIGLGSAFTAPVPPVLTALEFPDNTAGSNNIALVWSGGNLLPRTTHTVIWNAYYIQQTGYYASWWHTQNSGSFNGLMEYGTHPYPSAGGAVDGSGQCTDGTASSGTVHYYEIAGLGAHDYLTSDSAANGGAFLVTKGVWVTQARTAEISGSDTIHTFWPNVSNPTQFIRKSYATSNITGVTAFYLGSSDWAATAETPSGRYRNICLFNSALTIGDIASEAAGTGTSAVTSAGQAAVWYINRNPTALDINDKSAAGHTPSWRNANRPTTYTLP